MAYYVSRFINYKFIFIQGLPEILGLKLKSTENPKIWNKYFRIEQLEHETTSLSNKQRPTKRHLYFDIIIQFIHITQQKFFNLMTPAESWSHMEKIINSFNILVNISNDNQNCDFQIYFINLKSYLCYNKRFKADGLLFV